MDKLTPALPTASERHAADIASWGTVLTSLALDTKASWDSQDRTRAFVLQGVRVGAAYASTYAVKKIVRRVRPCSPDCGLDDPETSFFSGHTMGSFTALGGPRLAFALPLAVSTGGLRVAAGKHWLSDTLVGAAVGAAFSRIR